VFCRPIALHYYNTIQKHLLTLLCNCLHMHWYKDKLILYRLCCNLLAFSQAWSLSDMLYYENTWTWRDLCRLICLLTYAYVDIHWTGCSPIKHKVNLIQLNTFELELDFAQYTVSQKYMPLYFVCNFAKCWPIFKILSLTDSVVNLQ